MKMKTILPEQEKEELKALPGNNFANNLIQNTPGRAMNSLAAN